MDTSTPRWIGYVAMVGGAGALALAPVMVAVKYMTGWAIVPEPFWVPGARAWLAAAFPATTPAELWMRFGSAYSVALLLIVVALLGLAPQLRGRSRGQQVGYWLLTGGLVLVLPGDAVHSWTWHQNGLTIPTPGTNPVANRAYAVHMMGMNFVMAGSLITGVTALRRRALARWAAWLLALTFPAALLASLSLLPTTPSGALWLLSVLITLCGYHVARRGHLTRAVSHASAP
jgi:hypothetical protein